MTRSGETFTPKSEYILEGVDAEWFGTWPTRGAAMRDFLRSEVQRPTEQHRRGSKTRQRQRRTLGPSLAEGVRKKTSTYGQCSTEDNAWILGGGNAARHPSYDGASSRPVLETQVCLVLEATRNAAAIEVRAERHHCTGSVHVRGFKQ